MKKKSFCYAVRWANNGQKHIGGMLHADCLEQAAELAIARSGAKLDVSGTKGWPRIRWMKDGREVYISVSVHADHHVMRLAKDAYDALPMDRFCDCGHS